MKKEKEKQFTIVHKKSSGTKRGNYLDTVKGKKKGTFLGKVIAETSFSAYKKAIRIENSTKPCAWRGVDWTIKEFNSPFGYNNKKKKDMARKHCRKVIKEWDHQRQEHDTVKLSVVKKEADGGNRRIHSYNGCVNWD